MVVVHHGLFWDRDARVVDATYERPAEGAVRRRHHARGVPPRARRASGARQQRAARPRARSRARDRYSMSDTAARSPSRWAPTPSPRGCATCWADVSRWPSSTGRPRSGAWRSCPVAALGCYPLPQQPATTLFLTGEPAEPTMMAARELGIHFIAGGHYATERLGVQALSRRLAEQFSLDWHFIELTNPV